MANVRPRHGQGQSQVRSKPTIPGPRLSLLLTLYTSNLRRAVRTFIGASVASTNLLQGTLDLLILKSVALGELHGLGVSRRIEQITRGTFHVKPGSLFPALHRMQDAGWLISRWGVSENNRRAKYYRLTAAGRRQFEQEVSAWQTIAVAIRFALQAT